VFAHFMNRSPGYAAALGDGFIGDVVSQITGPVGGVAKDTSGGARNFRGVFRDAGDRAPQPAIGICSSSSRISHGTPLFQTAINVQTPCRFHIMPTTPQQQLEAFFDKYDPEIATLGRKALAHMRKRLPGAVATVYDNYNALAIGFGPEAKASAMPLSIALYPRWVTLFLMQGAKLDDPEKLMTGSGSRVRSIRLDGLATLKDPDVDALISAAVMHAGWRLDPKAKGELVIKSISPKQRPRRP
jgi:hypothetical protein